MNPLESWLDKQYGHCLEGLLRSISPSSAKKREKIGQIIVPQKGSVVASPILASYDPDPDYFFHWYRDSALVMDALRLVQNDVVGARQHLHDFVQFSLSLATLDGREFSEVNCRKVDLEFVPFLRKDLGNIHGQAIQADTRVNPDGTLDVLDWPRPQYDGPALRALTLLRWGVECEVEAKLLRSDLAFITAHARKPCFDIWEEEVGLHYYTSRVSQAALKEGAHWLNKSGELQFASICLQAADQLEHILDEFWTPQQGYLRSRILPNGHSPKELDISVILAANHSCQAINSRLMTTFETLTKYFAEHYAINRGVSDGPAMGRYPGDTYYSGGAYYFSTLGAAEFAYRAGDIRRGDAFLETVRRYVPASGILSEQFDQNTGLPASAKDLAWSYAAFVTCIYARREVQRGK